MLIALKNNYARSLPVICLLLSLLLTSCGPFGDNTPSSVKMVKAPTNKQLYTVPEISIADFDTLDPARVHDTSANSVTQMMFTGLVQLNNKLQLTPQLAQSWHLAADGVSWTFRLKPHLTFSDGQPLTASDVAYSLDRALQPATQSTTAPLYLSLINHADQLVAGKITTLIGTSLLIPDTTTLVIITSKKAAYFPAMLTSTCSFVVEKSIVQRYGAKYGDHLDAGGGAGPFKMQRYAHGQYINLVPNAHYYHAKPQLQRVSFLFYHSAEEAYQAYQNNKLDLTDLPIANYDNDKKHNDFHQVPQLWINYYTMNYLIKPFDNIHIRQAFALAIDKTAIAQDVWKGTVIPTNHIVPPAMPGYNPRLSAPASTQGLRGNAQKARDLLQQGLHEEGWQSTAQMPRIVLTYAAAIPSFAQEVQTMISMWQKTLNVTVESNAIDYNTLLDKVTGSTLNRAGLQMWGLAWIAEYPDPQDWLSLQFGNGVPNNNMNYGQNSSSNAALQQQVQQQLADADANLTSTARMRSYQLAEQQIVNDVAWLPMEQVTSTFLRSPTIIGITDNAQGLIPPDDWANIYRVQPASS